MAFTNLPLVDAVIEQSNLLEKRFHDKLVPGLAYAGVAQRFPIKARGGETLTVSRPALFPLAATGDIINPANRNSQLDNGLTPVTFGYEQVVLAVQAWAKTSDVSLDQEQVLIASLVQEVAENLGQNAAAEFEQNVAIMAHTAYDSGNTFATAAVATPVTAIHVDNINGFDTAYSTVANSSPGAPQAVGASNTLVCNVYNGSTGALKGQITLSSATGVDGSNTSTAQQNGVVYGRSGTLNCTSESSFAIAAGDNIVAVDGSYVLRPNSKPSRYQLATSDSLTLILLAQAAAKLKARGVRPMSNGLYCAIVDPLILPQLINDTAWQRATATTLESARYFKRGIPLPMYGIEVVESNMVPAFSLPAGGSAAGAGVERHALVVGEGAFLKAPYDGLRAAISQVESNSRAIHRIKAMQEDIFMVLRSPMDRLADWMSMTWKWTGAFAAMTDVTSTPAQIPTSDFSRYKRCVPVGVYNPF